MALMRGLFGLVGAAVLSIISYFLLFGAVVERPLVVDLAGQMMQHKLAYAASSQSPKLFILAGSNARFSHSCAVIEHELHRPCSNLGITAEAGLDWVIDSAKPMMRRGDLVYMPIEYSLYSQTRTQLLTGMDAAYRFRHD